MILKRHAIWLKNKICGCDIYGKTINFTYKGEDQYKTFIGGAISIVIMWIMVVYTYSLFKTMIDYKNTNSIVNTVYQNLDAGIDPLILDTDEFNFIFKISYSLNGERKYYTNNDTVFSLFIYQVRSAPGSSENVIDGSQEIGYSNWLSQNESSNPSNSIMTDEYICLDSSNYELNGDDGSSDHRRIHVRLQQWK